MYLVSARSALNTIWEESAKTRPALSALSSAALCRSPWSWELVSSCWSHWRSAPDCRL